MESYVPYIAAGTIVVATFLLRPLRFWLEARANALTGQSELVDIYQTNVARFLRATDADSHAEVRDMLVWAGYQMMKGTWLVDNIADGPKGVQSSDAEDQAEPVEDEFDSLPTESKHLWARAMGAALCVSASQSPLHKARHDAMLKWILSESGEEVREPKQVVHRFRQASQLPAGKSMAA